MLQTPTELRTADFLLRPITADDAAGDFEAVMESRDQLLGWEQSGWPEPGFTVDDNRADLASLEADHRNGKRFTYTVLDPSGSRTLGCVYIVAPTVAYLARAEVTRLGSLAWDDVQMAVYFWIRTSMADSLEPRLVAALRSWLTDVWGLERVVFATTADFERQVQLLEDAGLTRLFEIREPKKPTPYLAFG